MARRGYLLILPALLALSGCGDETTTISACAAPGVLMPDLSLSIDGTGFFTLSTDGELRYSRKGDFCVDQSGFLINGRGYPVQGYSSIGDGTFDVGNYVDLRLLPTGPSGGILSDATFSASGVLEAVYTVGNNLVVGKLALATFPSPQNLKRELEVICRETSASGPPRRGEAGQAAFGTIQPGLQGPFVCEQGRFDARVVGAGYFRLNNAGTMQYDASIILGVDNLGYYVEDHGYRVSGYAADTDGNVVPTVVDLTTAATETLGPVATSRIEPGANLNAGSGPPVTSTFDPNDALSYNYNADVTVFDSFGSTHTTSFYFVKTAVANTWNLYLYLDGALLPAGGSPFQVLTFSAGALSSTGLVMYDPAGLSNGAADLAITLVTTGLTQTSAAYAVTSRLQDGYADGRVTATQIAANGEIRLDYSNGRSGLLLGQLVLVNFQSPGALVRSADGETYLETVGAGVPMPDVPGASGLGDVTTTAR